MVIGAVQLEVCSLLGFYMSELDFKYVNSLYMALWVIVIFQAYASSEADCVLMIKREAGYMKYVFAFHVVSLSEFIIKEENA